MTEWLYQTDSYLRSFEARVQHSGEHGVVLDRSAFYPGGGGQGPDFGRLTDGQGHNYQVTGSKQLDGLTWLLLAGEDRPAVGSRLCGQLDWDRRYALMRTHTALHMLSGIIWRDYQAQVTGGNMDPLEGRLDFELSEGGQELVREVEIRMAEEIEAARPISVAILPREEAFAIPDLIRTKINLLPAGITQIRTVNILGLDLQADGGTHVANTREVGAVRVAKYKSKGKGNKRLYLQLEEHAG